MAILNFNHSINKKKINNQSVSATLLTPKNKKFDKS